METSALRSRTMRAVKSKNTSPELYVRRLLHAQGYRYRLHRKDLPGCPDLVFNRRKRVIFVHGCFWHGHGCARGSRVPKSNTEYWRTKVARNRSRDVLAQQQLEASGWKVMAVWECELREEATLLERLSQFFVGSPS
jgi:DNA mismatch endonuclease (patch repair protein)